MIAIGVLVDTTIVQALLVPSLIQLFGRWNWWAPHPLRALHARLASARDNKRTDATSIVVATVRPMSIGASFLFIVVGAILRYAISLSTDTVDLDVIGLILMIAGFAGLAISVLFILISNNDDQGRGGPYDRGPPPPR